MRKIYCIFLITLFNSCSTEEYDNMVSTDECIINQIIPNERNSCQTTDSSGDSRLCKLIYVGDYKISNESKMYIPQYCLKIGNKVVYKNGNGSRCILELVDKSYKKVTSFSIPHLYCNSDSSKSIGYCFDKEVISLTFKLSQTGLRITIEISNDYDLANPLMPGVGDELFILRERNKNDFYYEFQAIINQRTLITDKIYFQENIDSILINGTTYYNVISNTISNPSSKYKYYYNKLFGLIGYVDSNQVLWSIK